MKGKREYIHLHCCLEMWRRRGLGGKEKAEGRKEEAGGIILLLFLLRYENILRNKDLGHMYTPEFL